MPQSTIATFVRRHAKAKNPDDPFPKDRVFPSDDEMMLFGEELGDFLDGFADIVATCEAQRRQLDALEV